MLRKPDNPIKEEKLTNAADELERNINLLENADDLMNESNLEALSKLGKILGGEVRKVLKETLEKEDKKLEIYDKAISTLSKQFRLLIEYYNSINERLKGAVGTIAAIVGIATIINIIIFALRR